jgi:hypothetical protein
VRNGDQIDDRELKKITEKEFSFYLCIMRLLLAPFAKLIFPRRLSQFAGDGAWLQR